MCSSPPEATSTDRPSSRTAGRRRCRERPCSRRGPRSARCARAKAPQVGAGPGAHVVLGIDVGGGAELGRQLDHVAAADLEVAALVDPAAARIDRRPGDRVRAGGMPSAALPALIGSADCDGWRRRCGRISAMRLPHPTGRHAPRQPRRARLRALAAGVRSALAGDRGRPRRRLAEGEPRRLRPPRQRHRAGRRSPTTSAATAPPRARCRPAAIADAGAMARLLGEVEGVDAGRVCVRGSSLGGFVADPRRGGRGLDRAA